MVMEWVARTTSRASSQRCHQQSTMCPRWTPSPSVNSQWASKPHWLYLSLAPSELETESPHFSCRISRSQHKTTSGKLSATASGCKNQFLNSLVILWWNKNKRLSIYYQSHDNYFIFINIKKLNVNTIMFLFLLWCTGCSGSAPWSALGKLGLFSMHFSHLLLSSSLFYQFLWFRLVSLF